MYKNFILVSIHGLRGVIKRAVCKRTFPYKSNKIKVPRERGVRSKFPQQFSFEGTGMIKAHSHGA